MVTTARTRGIQHRPDRPDKPWRVRWREEGRERSRSFRSEDDALAFLVDNRRRLEQGAHAVREPSAMHLAAWLERWFAVYAAEWAEQTVEQRTTVRDRHVLPFIGGCRLRDLGRARLIDYRAQLLDADRTPTTVNAVFRVLSASLSEAAREGLIPANPLRTVRALRVPSPNRRAIPHSHVEAVLAAMPSVRDQVIVSLMVHAGLRPGEVRALQWSDWDGEHLRVTRSATRRGKIDTTKSGRGRVVPVRRDGLVHLARWRELAELFGETSDRLVVSGTKGGVLDWDNWTLRVWRPAMRDLGFEYKPYECRHTFASMLLRDGVDVVRVAAWMGHAKPSTTLDHYCHMVV